MTTSTQVARTPHAVPPTRMQFRIMGRTIATDFAFRDLPPASAAGATTVLASTAPFPDPGALVREVSDGPTGAPFIRVSEGCHGLQYWMAGVGSFWVEPAGTRVWYRLAPGCRTADVEHVLAGPVLGLAFQLQGQVQLHASAVVLDGAAVAFAASHGAGKSTLAASFARAGHALLTDDILPLADGPDGWSALRSLARIKLWEDSLTALGDDPARYDVVMRCTDKRRVPLGERWGAVAPDSVPLAAIYLLTPHAEEDRRIEVTNVAPLEAAMRLLGNMYIADALRGERAARALAAAAGLAASVPVRRLAYPRAYATLPALREAIIADVRRSPARR